MSIFNFCPASLLLPLRPTFLTYTSSQLLFMWMVLSSNVFVQPFIVFPSHILLQFQSYHQFSSLCPISIPAPYLISLSFEDLFQIPPIIPRKVNFYSPHPRPSITYFHFLLPLNLMWSLLSLKFHLFAPQPCQFSPLFWCARGRYCLQHRTQRLFAFRSSVWIKSKSHTSPEINA